MERMQLGPEPKVYHLGWEGGKARPGKAKHDGVLTVAIREEAPQVMVVGFTFCSPTDQFDRNEGRNKALYRMNEWPLRCRFIGNPFKTLHEVLRALCCKEFDELGHYCGEHLDAHLFSTKLVLKFVKGGVPVYSTAKVCRVPAWAKSWWYSRVGAHPERRGIRVEKRSPLGRALTDLLGRTSAGFRGGFMDQADLPPEVRAELDRVIQRIRTGGPLHD